MSFALQIITQTLRSLRANFMVKEPHMLHRAQAVQQEKFMLWLLQDVSKQRKELCVYLCVYSCGSDGMWMPQVPQAAAEFTTVWC